MKFFDNIQERSPLSKKQALIIALTYFLGYSIGIPFLLVIIDLMFFPGFATHPITDIVFHLSMTVVFLWLARDLLAEAGHHWSKWALYVPLLAAPVMLYGNFGLSIIISLISGESESVNQALLFEQFKAFPWTIVVQAVIFAPIVEEIIFRGVLYRHFKKAGRFIIPLVISTLLFAALHSLAAVLEQSWSDLWFIVVYGFMGLVLAYTYEKTQNLYSAILLHMINNAISIAFMFLAIK